MDFKIGHATEFSEAEIAAFKKIVLEKGQVSENSFDGLVAKNPILLFLPDTTNIDAVSALKIPYESHKSDVFTKSKSELKPNDFKYGLGWIVSLKKGLGKSITEILSKEKMNVYATVREENTIMQHILKKYGEFKQSGKPYQSDMGDYRNLLFVKINK